MPQAWNKEKIWVPDRIRTYVLPNTGRALYPFELRRTHGERDHILQGSAISMSYCVVKEWKMVNFKLGETKLCENWINQHVTGAGQGKKINKERKKVIEINTPKCSLKICNLRFLTIDNFLQKKTCRFVFDCLNGTTCFPFRNYFQRFHHNSLNTIKTMGKQQNYPSI